MGKIVYVIELVTWKKSRKSKGVSIILKFVACFIYNKRSSFDHCHTLNKCNLQYFSLPNLADIDCKIKRILVSAYQLATRPFCKNVFHNSDNKDSNIHQLSCTFRCCYLNSSKKSLSECFLLYSGSVCSVKWKRTWFSESIVSAISLNPVSALLWDSVQLNSGIFIQTLRGT